MKNFSFLITFIGSSFSLSAMNVSSIQQDAQLIAAYNEAGIQLWKNIITQWKKDYFNSESPGGKYALQWHIQALYNKIPQATIDDHKKRMIDNKIIKNELRHKEKLSLIFNLVEAVREQNAPRAQEMLQILHKEVGTPNQGMTTFLKQWPGEKKSAL